VRKLGDNVLAALVTAFMAAVLLIRFSLPPRSWRHLAPLMTTEQLRVQLGDPQLETSDQARWRDDRLFGEWQLIVRFSGPKVAAFDEEFIWF
jgi:hypothetical protein